MRRISSAAVIGLLVAMQGCTINIPNNLFNNLIIAATPGPKASGGGDLPKKGGPEPVASIPPFDIKPVPGAKFYGFESCEHALKKLDTDGDGRLGAGEFAVWTLNLHAPAVAPCVTPDSSTVANGRDRAVLTSPVREDKTSPPLPMCEPAAPQPALPPFEHWDKNRDQFIDRGELCEQIAVPPLPPQRPACEETFKRADRNADGSLSPEEYFAADYAPPPPDGMVRPAVMPTEGELAARFKGLDVTGDGKLELKEFCMDWGTMTLASPAPTPAWNDCYGTVKSYDRNQDGKVSWEEYYEGFLLPISARYDGQKDEVYARYKALDANGDGALTPEEYCPPNTTPAPESPKPAVMNEANR